MQLIDWWHGIKLREISFDKGENLNLKIIYGNNIFLKSFRKEIILIDRKINLLR